MNSGIYEIRNKINGNFYVGSTKNTIDRFKNHRSTLIRGVSTSTILQRAVNKYGIDNFDFKLIATCHKEYLIKMEQWFIDNMKPQYNVIKNVTTPSHRSKKVINLTTGEEFKSLTEAAEKYNTYTSAIGRVCRGEGLTALGCKWIYKDNPINKKPTQKKIVCIETSQIFNSAAEAARHLNLKSASHIIQICMGNKKSKAGGFTWKYY